MFCSRCNNPVADCECGDIEERLEKLANHVGTKLVWRRSDLPDDEVALTTPHVFRESRYDEDDNEWDNYLFKARGDCPDEEAVEIAAKDREDPDAELVIEHWPPTTAYPESIEEDAERELRPARADMDREADRR